ncbi:hypothetical protein AB6E77_15815 [Vibrio sp. 10N.247.311.18]|uniref:glycosyltransferase family protein n=1 Tax=unclassified Vibrio TaxID=2614977 RepID=UPI00354CC0EE
MNNISFGVIYLSPVHPEMEIMRRLRVAALALGHKCYFINPRGIDVESGNDISELLDFALVFDPSHHTFIDTVLYHVHWFCPGITSSQVRLNYNYSSLNCDKHFIFPSESIVEHYKKRLPENNISAQYLFPSVPRKYCKDVVERLSYKVFYCGVNNDGAGGIRHGELFSQLDSAGCLEIYGPEKINGKPNWEGLVSYKGQIAFDGFSVMNVASSCGIYLVLQHDLHNLYGMMTNRLFEACASGCLVISDDIAFVRDNFQDSVFYLDKRNKSVDEIAAQIISIVDWANANPDAARNKAKQSQDIFYSKFLLDDILSCIVDDHRKQALSPIESSDSIDIFVTLKQIGNLQVQKNLTCQTYGNFRVVVVLEPQEQLSSSLKQFLESFNFAIVYGANLFSSNEQQPMLRVVRDNITSRYFIFVNELECWHSRHVELLVSAFSKRDDVAMVYSGSYIREAESAYNTALTFRPINGLEEYVFKLFREESSMLELSHLLPTSSMMFSVRVLEKEYLIGSIILEDPSYLLLAAAIIDGDNVFYGNRVSVSIERVNFIDYLNRNTEVFINKSYATSKGAILDTLIYNPNVTRDTHSLFPTHLISSNNLDIENKTKELEQELENRTKEFEKELANKTKELEQELVDLKVEVKKFINQSSKLTFKRVVARLLAKFGIR